MAAATIDNLFSVLPSALSSSLFSEARVVRLAPQQMLFIAGDPGDGCYQVEEGLLKVVAPSPSGGDRILAILGPGELVGELSMIDGLPRSASVSALRESKLSFVSRSVFNAVAHKQPEIYRHIAALVPGALCRKASSSICLTRKSATSTREMNPHDQSRGSINAR